MLSSDNISKYRVFPRVFSVFYLYCGYEVQSWIIALPDPSAAQAGYAGAFAATVVGWFKYYVDGGK